MEIVPDLTKSNLSKNQIEYIQKKQHEYKLMDKKRKRFQVILCFRLI